MKNQTILNNSYAANIFLPLLVTFLRLFENKWYLPVAWLMRFFLFLIAFPSQPQLYHFQKYIILNISLKVNNILNRDSNHTSFAP